MNAIMIKSFARVHFGLLQLSEFYSRRNMGLGAAVDSPCWHLRITRASVHEGLVVEASEDLVPADIVEAGQVSVRSFQAIGDRPIGMRVEVAEAIPPHIGLGSKTAFLRALRSAYGLLVAGDPTFVPLKDTGRGGTSGIGVNLSDVGGVVVDTGHLWSPTDVMDTSRMRAGAPIPNVLMRHFVDDGPILLARVRDEVGPSGAAESSIFRRHLPLHREEVDQLAGIVLYEVLPALVSGDWAGFGRSIAAMQQLGFKKYEWMIQADSTKRLAQLAYEAGAHCAALSSMGPTLAIIADNPQTVGKRLEALMGESVLVQASRVRNAGMEWSTNE